MPDHLDFLKHGLSLQQLACEAALIADNFARLAGATVPDSIALTYQLLETWKCVF